MNTWLKLKTKPFVDFEDAEKFIRHFKSINPKRKYKVGVADGDIVVFVISKGSNSDASGLNACEP
jgi:hypothetical protein